MSFEKVGEIEQFGRKDKKEFYEVVEIYSMDIANP